MLSSKMPKHRNVLKKSTHWIENRPAGTIEKKAERKVFMEIQITQKQCGGTEFLARPHRLHLGAQNAAGVDQLHFILPEAWALSCAPA